MIAFRFLLLSIVLGLSHGYSATIEIAPAPHGEPLSADYIVKVQSRSVPVYECKVAAADKLRRWKAMDDKTNSALYFEKASFCSFDTDGSAELEVRSTRPISTA